jgi:hypothetical protein
MSPVAGGKEMVRKAGGAAALVAAIRNLKAEVFVLQV